ncbi:MAG: ATP-binding protein [Kofleriaceae bacterium]
MRSVEGSILRVVDQAMLVLVVVCVAVTPPRWSVGSVGMLALLACGGALATIGLRRSAPWRGRMYPLIVTGIGGFALWAHGPFTISGALLGLGALLASALLRRSSVVFVLGVGFVAIGLRACDALLGWTNGTNDPFKSWVAIAVIGLAMWFATRVLQQVVSSLESSYEEAAAAYRLERETAAHVEYSREERDGQARGELVSTLAGGVAHQVNNSLAAIVTAAGMLRDELADADDKRAANEVEAAALRAAARVRDLTWMGCQLSPSSSSARLADTVERVRDRLGADYQLDLNGSAALDLAIPAEWLDQVLYWVICEGGRTGATQFTLAVRTGGTSPVLEIRSIAAEPRPSTTGQTALRTQLGITAAREALARVGGALELADTPFVAHVTLPSAHGKSVAFPPAPRRDAPPDAPPDHDAEPRLRAQVAHDLRVRIRRGLDGIVAYAAAIACVVQGVAATRAFSPLAVGSTVTTGLIAACAFAGRRAGASWVPHAYVVLIIVGNVVYLLAYGPLLGLGAIYMFAITLAFVFLSPRWRVGVAAALVITLGVIGGLASAGVINPQVLALGDARTWLRTSVAAAAAMIAIGVIVGYAVRHMVLARAQVEAARIHVRDGRKTRASALARRASTIVELAASVGNEIGVEIEVIMRRSQELLRRRPDAAIVNDVLEAARTSEQLLGALAVFAPARQTSSPCNIATTARDLPSLMHKQLPGRIRLDVSVDVDATIPLGEADAILVLANLVLNARDAIRDTGVIGVHVDANSESVKIVVSDDGSGMDARTRALVFEPFFTTKGMGLGTGLGLATTKALVERAGGSIELESEPGRGTRCSIRLPRVAEGPFQRT